MPTLFISYKRGTAAVAPLMERLKAAHYRLWFDRDEIHLGDPDWQARIDQGIERCDGVILNLTPDACKSKAVQYEVRKALDLHKPIFPIVLERLESWGDALEQVGLSRSQHTEDFTDVERWDKQIERLLGDLEIQGLRVTRHDRRQQRDRNNPNYVLHQTYLKRLAERVGTLNLAQINPAQAQGVDLERVYVDSPIGLNISVEVQDWQVVDWWIQTPGAYSSGFSSGFDISRRSTPQDLGYERAPFEALLGQIDAEITRYRQENPKAKPDEEYEWRNYWNNGEKENVLALHLNHLAAANNRLVILGAPGSGKSTFVKYLALCLAGSGIDDWPREATIVSLDNWPHGALTPVYVELRHFVASRHFPADMNTPATADHLWAYIQHELLGDSLAPYAEDLRYDLEHGHAVLILDGLDEVPYPEGKLKDRQNQLIRLAQSLNTRYTASRIIVASRPYAYENWTLPGFEVVMITEFEDHHRIDLARRLYVVSGLAETDAENKAQALNKQLRAIDPELKDRPLFVTLMATLYLRGDAEGLPTRRGALYRESILLLLDRWTQTKPDAPSLVEILGDQSPEDVYLRLAALAYDVHRHYGQQPGTPDIDEGLLYKYLKPLGRGVAAELIPYLSENAGVLVSPGQNEEKDVFRFAHRTFQEYLAAVNLVGLCAEADSFEQVRQHITRQPQVWRVPCTLVGDVLADTARRGDLWDLLDDLLDDEVPNEIGADDPRWWTVWLASEILQEQTLLEAERLRRSESAVCDQLRLWILKLIETPQALDPVERAACGRALSLAKGDTRPGVGVIVRDGVTLPDIVWGAPVLPGVYPVGHKDEEDNPPRKFELKYSYQLATYPVTYAQFQTFVDDPEGYLDPRWWGGLAVPDGHNTAPGGQSFKYDNHPRERVSWYEAMAFCRWLSWRWGGGYDLNRIDDWAVRLPTETEWEIAARGVDGRVYPYAEDFDATKGNTSETGILQTSAVGIFPDGASPYGLLDMSGNVFEWCLTDSRSPVTTAAQENLSADFWRVLRGGAWLFNYGLARAVFRTDLNLSYRLNIYGFRVYRP